MKKFYNLLLVTIFSLVASSISLKAQCPNDNTEYTSLSAPATIGQSVGILGDGTPICIYAGEYYTVTNFQAGFTYRISTCLTTDIADTRLTVYPSAGGGAVGFNDDFCGLLAQFDFTPSSSGNYRVLLDATGPGNTCTTAGENCGVIVITLISNSTGGAYCTPIYGNPGGTSGGDYIDGVSLGSINNQNTGSALGASYNNYTNLSTVLNPSTQYTLSIKNNPDYTEKVSAWIDYNQDLTFSEDERLGQISINDAEVGTITFTTPAVLIDGATRLRVRMGFTIPTPGGLIDPCTSIQLGETEDYTVVLETSSVPPTGLNFSTICGLGAAIPDNNCPNYTLASVTAGGLGTLGTTHSIKSAEILISHPMAADLDLYLVAPNGQIVELSTDNGGDGSNYGTYSLDDCSLRTVFDQSASTSITAGVAPFIGTFIPEGNLNDFNTSAINPNGVWRLRACDDFAGDAGVIQFFKLNFELNPTELPACADAYSIPDAATDVSVSEVLSWTAGTGSPDTYDVYFGTSATPSLASNDQVGLSYSTTLSAATTYYYQIVPANSVGSATGCPIRSFTTASAGVVYVMANGTVNTCSGTFVDDGGIADNYGNDQFLTYTVFPSTPGSVVKVDFSSIDLDGLDLLAIGDGVDLFAPAIGTFFGGSYTDTSFTATNPDGALTFLFFSDASNTAPGWIGTFSCVAPQPIPDCATNLSPADNATDVSTATSITWTAATGNPTGYDVYFGTSSTPPLVETNQPETSYTPISLLPATTYYYIISPLNASGAATCDTLSFTTAAIPEAGILMGSASLIVCDTAFFDAGGSIGTAGLNQNSVLVLTPSTPNSHLVVTFNAFNTETTNDALTAYNGNSVASAVIGTYSGSSLSVPFVVTSTAADGSLTFQFVSDGQTESLGWSAQVSCLPNDVLPACVVSPSPEDQSNGTSPSGVVLSWTAGDNVTTSYDVYFGTDAVPTTLVSDNQAGTTYNAGDLALNTQYFWRVISNNNVGSSSDCDIYSFTTSGTIDILMSTDTISTCDANFFDSGGASGNYSSNSDLTYTIFPGETGSFVRALFTSFNLEATFDFLKIYNGNSASAPLIGTFSETGPAAAITSSALDGSLTFVFTSDDSNTASGWEATISCFVPVNIPGCVTNPSPANNATNVSIFNPIVSWTPGDGVSNTYDVYGGSAPDQLLLVSDNQVGTSFSAPAQLAPNTTYYWQVIPANSFGSPTDCPVFSFTTGSSSDIIMFSGSVTTCDANFYDSGGLNDNYSINEDYTLTVLPGISNNAVQVSFAAFDLEADFDSLLIYDGNSTGAPLIGTFSAAAPAGVITSSATDGSLTFHFFSDESVAVSGWEATISCVEKSVAPGCAIDQSPANSATNVANTDVTLSWAAGSGVTEGYDVYFGTSANALSLVSDNQLGNSFSAGNLELGSTYFWQVIPYNTVGSAADCQVLSFTTTSTPVILFPINGSDTATTCDATIYDSGGPEGTYQNFEEDTLTLFPDQLNSAVRLLFSSFTLEEDFDFLRIYNGNSTSAPLIGEFSASGPAGAITSSAADGSLTITFSSDESGRRAGFAASVSCVPTDEIPGCVTEPSPADLAIDISPSNVQLSWSAGSGVTTSYSVYFGLSSGSLDLVSENQAGTTYDTGVLELNTSYSWYVVPSNSNGEPLECEVYSFTTAGVIDIVQTDGETFNSCNANYYDAGGLDGVYPDNENSVTTICPDQPNSAIKVVFTSFDLEQNLFFPLSPFDWISIYNGTGTNSSAAFIDPVSGTNKFFLQNPGTFISTAEGGCLTFNFQSDESNFGAYQGWEATVTCLQTDIAPDCASNLFPVDLSDGVDFVSNLSWSAPAGFVSGYDVYFGSSADNLVLVSANQAGTTFTTSALDTDSTYFWSVVPRNDGGSAIGCDTLSFTVSPTEEFIIFDGEATVCSGNLFDTGGSEGNYSDNEFHVLTLYPSTPGSFVRLTFNSFFTEDGFDFFGVFDGNTTTGALLADLTGELSPAPVTSTSPDGSLTLVFFSDEDFNESGFDISVSCFTPAGAPECATILSPLDNATGASLNASLTWESGGGFPTGYDVYFGTSPDNLTLVSDNQIESSFSPSDMLANTEYFWQVIPSNEVGLAEGCAVNSFTTAESIDINMFTGETTTCNANFFDPQGPNAGYLVDQDNTLTVNPATPNSAISVTFNTFNTELGYDSLTIYDGTSTNGVVLANLSGNLNATLPLTITSQTGSLTFHWSSDEDITFAGWSAVISCVDTTVVPNCVANESPINEGTGVDNTGVTLSWNNPGFVAGYDVYFSTDPTDLVLVSDNQTGTNYNAGNLELNTTYYWQVVPFNSTGAAVGCEVFSFTTTNTPNINMYSGTLETCNANFFDPQGPNSNYARNVLDTLVVTPSSPNSVITVTFDSFASEEDSDLLTIFDGASASGTQLAILSGDLSALTPLTFTSSTGSLTFVWESDAAFVDAGWSAVISCLDTTATAVCAVNVSPANESTGVCVNDVIRYTAGPGSLTTSYDVYFGAPGDLVLVADNVTSTTFDPGPLDPNTEYAFQIIPSNEQGSASECQIYTFTTGTCFIYCEASSECDEFISNVEIGTINNASDCTPGGYASYIDQSTNVSIGIESPITITDGLPYAGDQCGIWVDWNQDGDFADAGETIDVNPINAQDEFTGLILPPAGALLGSTTMRVRIAYLGNLDPCGTLEFGETEDYTLIVQAAPLCAAPANIQAGDITDISAVITWNPVPEGSGYVLRYRKVSEPTTVSTWSTPLSITAPTTTASLAGLNICTDYVLQVGVNCPDAEGTNYSPDRFFTSRCYDCEPGTIAENEACGENSNGGCNSSPVAYDPISCGQIICGSAYNDGTIRDTDWFKLTVDSTGIYTANIQAGFAGTMFAFADVSNCLDITAPYEVAFTPNTPFTVSATLTPGTYAIILVPRAAVVFACGSSSKYTLELTSPITQIAPVAPVCAVAEAFDLFAVPAGGTWSGTGITSTSNGTFDPAVSGIGSFTITYNSEGSGCNPTDTLIVTVLPAPQASITLADTAFCTSEDPINLVGTPAGGVFTINSPGGAGIVGGTFDPSLVSAGSYEITYSLNEVGSCPSSVSQTITVVAGPVVNFTEVPSSVCSNADPIVLSATPAGGTFSGSGVTGNSFDPSEATIGSNVITYTVSDEATTCSASGSQTIQVNAAPEPADFVGLAASYCTTEDPAVLTGIPSGGNFSIAPGNVGIVGNTFDPSLVDAGDYSITYTVSVGGNCPSTRTQSVTVVDAPVVSFSDLQASVCANADTITLSATPSGGTFSGSGVSGTSFIPSDAALGANVITYSVTSGSCSASASQSIQVNPVPVVSLSGLDNTYCLNSASVELIGTPGLGTFSGPGVTGSSFSPSAAGLGSHVITYSFNNGTCTGSDQLTVSVTEAISVVFGSTPSTTCSEDDPFVLTSVPAGATFSGDGVFGNTFSPRVAGLGAHTITATLNQGNCSATATQSITVNPSPTASFNYSANGGSVVMINSSTNAVAYTWDFGDNSTSTASNPTHVYTTNGAYTITLVATSTSCGSDTFSLELKLSVGIGSIDGVDMIQLYPNPTNGNVNLNFNSLNQQSFEVRITDATGRLLQTDALTNYIGQFSRIYDLSDRAKGIYFFTISSEKGAVNFRVVRD